MWAAQGLAVGGAAWASGGGVAIGCPGLSGLNRLILHGSADDAVRLAGAAVEALGPSFMLSGDPDLMTALLARHNWLEHGSYFGWMDGVSRPRHCGSHSPRWLARSEWQSADRVLRVALPASFARPGLPAVGRWAGITDDGGYLTSTAADAWSAPGIGFLASLAVVPEARRSGQGLDLGAFVLSALYTRHGRVALMVRDWDTAAIGLYSRLGLSYRRQQVLRVRLAPVASP